jgi:hypothetical protein
MQIALPLPEPDEIDLPSLAPTPTGDAPTTEEKRFNYFNYFTEIEDAFVARRGAPMIISSLDWALIESWRAEGVPLHIVLRGIAHAFDRRDAAPSHPLLIARRVNSLMYCQQAVLTEYAGYRQSQVGAAGAGDADAASATETPNAANEPFPVSLVVNFLETSAVELERMRDEISRFIREEYPHVHLHDATQRTIGRLRELAAGLTQATDAPSMEKLEADLTVLDDALFGALRSDVAPETSAAIEREATAALKPYKKRMEAAAYQQTLENYVARQMRLHYGMPRLSLFYLRPE